MFHINRTIAPPSTSFGSTSLEVGSSQTHVVSKPSRLQRQQFLEELRDSTENIVIPLEHGGQEGLRQTLERFRATPAFSMLMTKTIDALENILLFTKQEFGKPQSVALEKSLGVMLSKMRLPHEKNPWSHLQSSAEKEHLIPYSTEEMLHAYQSSCRELQIIEKLMHIGLNGGLDLTPQQAKEAIKPAIAELPLSISVCGAGSLINIEDLLKKMQDQLLPCDLSEKFDNQVELIAQEHIRELLRGEFKNDPYHEVNEIHRVKAVRFLASSLCGLPEISIDKDPYAKTFFSELSHAENFQIRMGNIQESLKRLLKQKIRPDVICMDLAIGYFERIQGFLISKGLDVQNIPYNSMYIDEAINSLSSEYGSPPANYLFGEVDREDYSRCLSPTPMLLASWFFMKLVESTPSLIKDVQQQKTLFTKSVSNGSHMNYDFSPKKTLSMRAYQEDRVYQIHDLCWANDVNPILGRAEQVKIENLSPEWVSRKFRKSPADPEIVNVFKHALVNTVNQIKGSRSGVQEKQEELKSFLNSEAFRKIGLDTLSRLPLSCLDSEEKITALFAMQLAAEEDGDRSCLSNVVVLGLDTAPRDLFGRLKRHAVIEFAVSQANKNSGIMVSDNEIAKRFVSKIVRDDSSHSWEMLKSDNLLSWAIKNGNMNFVSLIVLDYKSNLSEADFKKTLNYDFGFKRSCSDGGIHLFEKWPIHNNDLRTSGLGLAAMIDNLELAKIFLNEGLNPNAADKYGYPPLTYASAYSAPALVEYLISQGAKPDGIPLTKKSASMPPILAAALLKRTNMVEALLKAGADVNQSSSTTRMTALHAAYLTGDLDLIKKLYEYGANHEMKANFFDASPLSTKRTPLEMIVDRLTGSLDRKLGIRNRSESLRFAETYVFHQIHHGIPFNNKVLMHGYPLMHALAYQRNVDALKTIMSSLSNQSELKVKLLNGRSSKGTHRKTPLMVAAKQGASDVAAYLLSLDETNLVLTDSKGRTALDIAKKYGNQEICDLLSERMKSTSTASLGSHSVLSSRNPGASPFPRFFFRQR
jgi:ankyrin repeat protein